MPRTGPGAQTAPWEILDLDRKMNQASRSAHGGRAPIVALAQPIALPGHLDDGGVDQKAVQDGGGGRHVAEKDAPALRHATAMTALIWDRQVVDTSQSVDRGRVTQDLDDVNRA